ncbi:MAG: site-specific DNA-methyltransferase [Deltaproteobacteria bacterium]|nr:site-specific DNA-methyltransferase [Deltaproteobacteria bacterium]
MDFERLKLARNLLREDGVIMISIDDHEVDNLRKLCNEIFGEENFLAAVCWQKKYAPVNDKADFSTSHDYVLVSAKVRPLSKEGEGEADRQPPGDPDPPRHRDRRPAGAAGSLGAVRRRGQPHPILPPLFRGDGDRHRQDLRLSAHGFRAVPPLRFSKIHYRGAERGDPRGGAEEHRDHRRALPGALQQPPLRAFRLRRQKDQPAAAVRHRQQPADPGHQQRRLPQELHRHRGGAQEQRHLQGERPAFRAPAHRVRAGGAAHRHHRRAAERRFHRQGSGGDQGPQSSLHAALLGHPPQPLQPGLSPRPGARLRAEAGQADRGGLGLGRRDGQRRLGTGRADRLQKGDQGQAAHSGADSSWAEGEEGHSQKRRRSLRPVGGAGLLRPGVFGGRNQRRAGSRVHPLQQWPDSEAGGGDGWDA